MAKAPFIKHVGRHAGTGQRISVVFMQLPDDPKNALVVYSDSLPDRYHDAYMEAIESNEGQNTNNLYEVLSRKVFWHGKVMLDTLHKEGHLKKVPTEQIIMTPNTQTNVSLDEINDAMNVSDDTAVSEPEAKESKSRIDSNVESSQQDENKQIAQNLMVQANLLESDAIAKRQEAYKYDPSLQPKETKSKVRVTTGTTTDAPKKRGRPKKSVT
jgi:hypothetical protein